MGGQLLVIKPSLSLKLFLGCLHGISVALGVPIKVSMVRYLLSTPKGQGRSIDTLILHEQLINSMNMVIILTQVCSVLLPFESSAEPNVGQEAFCIIVQGLAVFTMVHRAIGGLGIATFRVFYIHGHSLLLRIGEETLRIIIELLGIVGSALIAIALILEYVFAKETH